MQGDKEDHREYWRLANPVKLLKPVKFVNTAKPVNIVRPVRLAKPVKVVKPVATRAPTGVVRHNTTCSKDFSTIEACTNEYICCSRWWGNLA